ncbi:hypothetical protein ABKE32_000472 [Escherichia albertii]
MKPEHIYKLTGRDVLRWRHRNTDSTNGMALAVTLGLLTTFILLVARAA